MSATTLTYRTLITTAVANQGVTLAESGTMGHRVQVPMSVDDLNRFFIWHRPKETPAPVGHFRQIDGSGVNFNDMLLQSLGKTYTDIDGVTNGLNFSSAILDANPDPSIRLNGLVSANDLCMAYMLFKCYQSSAAPTMNVIYNLADAQQMLTSGTLVLAIDTSLATEEAKSSNPPGTDQGAVNAMFKDLMAADPTRFFTAAGIQIPGLFEVAADSDSSGAWGFIENDKIEMRVQFTFTNAVTRSGVGDPAQAAASPSNTTNTDSVVIPAGSTFTIRLQLTATDTPSGAAIKQAASATALANADAAQQAAAAKAASNAMAAAAAAQNAVNAAAAQSAAATAAYNQAVATNAAQATAVSNANAALVAAQAALAAAQLSGSAADIQQQNAAAVAAQAAATAAQTIASQAATAVQNAATAKANAIQALDAAQTAAAAAAANVANANAAAAAASAKTAADAAAAAAAAKAAADAASDPMTSTLTQAEQVILNPQTVVTAQAKANAATQERQAAQLTANAAIAAANLATQKLTKDTNALALLIGQGGTLATIQIARSLVVSDTAAEAAAQAAATTANNALVAAANAELSAQQFAAKASSERFSLLSTIAASNVNNAQRILTAAQAKYTNITLPAFTAATAAAAAATAALNAAVAQGAVMIEVQRLTSASLAANNALATAKASNDAAVAAVTAAQAELTTAQSSAAAAVTAISTDAAASAQAASIIRTNLEAATDYQNNVTFLAIINQDAQALNQAQIARNSALINMNAAQQAYVIAQDALDAAVDAGGTVPTITSLRAKAQAAADLKTQTEGIYASSVNNYNALYDKTVMDASGSNDVFDGSGNVIINRSAAGILVTAAQQQITNINDATANTLVANFINLYAAFQKASVAQDNANQRAQAALHIYNNNIAGGLPLDQITSDSQKLTAANNAFALAQAEYDAANKAQANAMGAILAATAPTAQNALSILQAMQIMQVTVDQKAMFNELTAALNAANTADIAAQSQVVSDRYAVVLANAAIQDALAGGASVASLQHLQATVTSLTATLANSQHKADLLDAAFKSASENWALASNAIVSLDSGANTVLLNNTAVAAQRARAAAANTLVNNYMKLKTAEYAANSAYQKAQARYNLSNQALATAIDQGAQLNQIQTLQAAVQNDTAALSSAIATHNLAISASLSAYNALVNSDSSGNYIQDPSGNTSIYDSAGTLILSATPAEIQEVLQDALEILSNGQIVQNQSISNSYANNMVNAYLESFAVYEKSLTAYQAAQSATRIANQALDTAITSGMTVDQIQTLRIAAQNAAAAQSAAQTTMANALNAKDFNYQLIVSGQTVDNSGNPVNDGSGNVLRSNAAMNILIQTQIAQKNAIDNAQANALARGYMLALEAQTKARVNLTALQGKYDTAAAALTNAITAGAVIGEIQALQAAAQAAGQAVATAKAAVDNATAAVAVAFQGVNTDVSGNAASAILLKVQQYEADKVSLAKANTLIDKFHEATARYNAAANTLALAMNAQRNAATALDNAISSGAGIADIQALQATSTNAGIASSQAKTVADAAQAAMNEAQSEANTNPIANGILIAAAQFTVLAQATAKVNNDKVAVELADAAARAAALTASNDARAKEEASTILLNAIAPYDASNNPTGGKTQQEIVNMQAAATATAATASASMNASQAAKAALLAAQRQVISSQAIVDALPVPNPRTTFSYTMTCVRLNETAVSDDGLTIYVDSAPLRMALQGADIGFDVSGNPQHYDASGSIVNGAEIQGLGVLSPNTTIVSAVVQTSLPNSLYPNCVALTLSNPVSTTIVNGVFYLVGGENILYEYIL